jgi:hypothetical protein
MVSLNGIAKAFDLATKIIGDGNGAIDRIRAFTKTGHKDYNSGERSSQNFAVMVVKLVGMIADCVMDMDDDRGTAGSIKRLCESMVGKTRKESNQWWCTGKAIPHDPILDCDLYIENFNVQGYIGEARGALRYTANPNRPKNNLDIGGPEILECGKVGHVGAAYQILARLPDAIAAIERKMEYYAECGNECSVDPKLNASSALFGVCMLMCTQLMYGKDNEEIRSKLATYLSYRISKSGDGLSFNGTSSGLADGIVKLASGRYSSSDRTKWNCYSGTIELHTPGMIYELNELRSRQPERLGYYQLFSGVKSDVGSTSTYRKVKNTSVLDAVVETVEALKKDGRIVQEFCWLNGRWQDSSDQEVRDSREPQNRHRLKAAAVIAICDGEERHMAVYWPSTPGHAPFIRGGKWIDESGGNSEDGRKWLSIGDIEEVDTREYRLRIEALIYQRLTV